MRKTPINLICGLALLASCMPAIAATPDNITDPSEMLSLYDLEADAGRFEQALRYAVAGCERLKMLYLCREVADLPLQMASQGVVAPPRFAAEQRRIANVVCGSGKPYLNAKGVNIGGWLCNHFARQFARAYEPDRERTLLTRAQHYLDSIHDKAFAASLYQTACRNNSVDACNFLAATGSGPGAQSAVSSNQRPAGVK